ncbi:MAG TPA: NIPSNAP family protein [Bacteroidales bacterium]|nr:NIPSNAP family protein [Bacteroidales bacterium]
MKRKEFLTSAGLLGMAPWISAASGKQSEAQDSNQFVELIKYQLHPGERQPMVADFYKNVAIPALNRIGISNVGVFSPVYGVGSLSLYVIIPHKSLEAVYSDNEKLLEDKDYMKDGEKFLNPPMSNTSFVRMERSVFRAFNFLPKVEVPTEMMTNNSRIYEIRIYESPGFAAAKKKIQMFNEGGEIQLFKQTGLKPVFFGECISGVSMPNLHYMLVFNNMAERDANWATFVKSEGWAKLSKDPYYADTVSNITDIILRPAAFSQI